MLPSVRVHADGLRCEGVARLMGICTRRSAAQQTIDKAYVLQRAKLEQAIAQLPQNLVASWDTREAWHVWELFPPIYNCVSKEKVSAGTQYGVPSLWAQQEVVVPLMVSLMLFPRSSEISLKMVANSCAESTASSSTHAAPCSASARRQAFSYTL